MTHRATPPRLGRRSLLLLTATLAMLAPWKAAHAEAPLEPMEKLELMLRPDERSVERLFTGPDGHIYGVVGHAYEVRGRFIRIDADTHEVSVVEALPEPLVQPREPLLEGGAVAWTWDATGRAAYSLNEVGQLVRHTADGEETIGQVAGTRIREPDRHIPPGYQVSEALVWGPDDNLYTAGEEGHVLRYDPASEELEQLSARLPFVRGRHWWASLDAAALGPDGRIYGGTHDGYIFAFDPETEAITNFGKPLRQHRINGLVFRDGILYGVGGEEEGLARSFAFDPETHGFTLHGLTVGRHEFAPVSALVKDDADRIYLGTRGRLGELYVVPAEP